MCAHARLESQSNLVPCNIEQLNVKHSFWDPEAIRHALHMQPVVSTNPKLAGPAIFAPLPVMHMFGLPPAEVAQGPVS